MARPEPVKGVGCLVVSPEDMVKLEAVKFLLQLSYLLSVCIHAGVTTIRLFHDLIDDEPRVSVDIKPLNPMFGGNVQTVDQCPILRHIVGGTEL
jgi:hypothetical protein